MAEKNIVKYLYYNYNLFLMTIMVSLKFFIENLGGRGRFETSSNKFLEWIPYLCQVISSEKCGTTYGNLFSIFGLSEGTVVHVSGGRQLNESHGWGEEGSMGGGGVVE